MWWLVAILLLAAPLWLPPVRDWVYYKAGYGPDDLAAVRSELYELRAYLQQIERKDWLFETIENEKRRKQLPRLMERVGEIYVEYINPAGLLFSKLTTVNDALDKVELMLRVVGVVAAHWK